MSGKNQSIETSRVQLWSIGGGRQSVLMLGLIRKGLLPRPDHAVMVDTNRERSSTWAYFARVFEPELAAVGIPFTLVDRSKYSTVDLWSGADGDSCVLPAFTDRDGEGKLPEFCSNEWKRRCAMRWAAERPGWKNRGVDCWLGITTEEKHRRRGPSMQWWHATFPLLDVCPSHVSRVYDLCAEFGWPDPPRSCCWMCPNMSNEEWRDLRDNYPEDFSKAVALDREIYLKDGNIYLHSSRVPLALADLGQPDEPGLFGGGCSSGMCY